MEQEQKEKEKEKDSVSLLPTVAPNTSDIDSGMSEKLFFTLVI